MTANEQSGLPLCDAWWALIHDGVELRVSREISSWKFEAFDEQRKLVDESITVASNEQTAKEYARAWAVGTGRLGREEQLHWHRID